MIVPADNRNTVVRDTLGLLCGLSEPDNGRSNTVGEQVARRVVITGIGALTPVGIGREDLWRGVRRGCSAVRRITRFDASSFPSQIAAEVRDFRAEEFFEAR